MGKKRKIRNGFILKSDFCKKHNIKISKFNETLLEKGYLKYHLISTNYITGKKKYAIGIGDKGYSRIEPLHGSNQQGVFQYSEKLLNEIFEIKQEREA